MKDYSYSNLDQNSMTFRICMSHCYAKIFACIRPNYSNLYSLCASKCDEDSLNIPFPNYWFPEGTKQLSP